MSRTKREGKVNKIFFLPFFLSFFFNSWQLVILKEILMSKYDGKIIIGYFFVCARWGKKEIQEMVIIREEDEIVIIVQYFPSFFSCYFVF